MAKTQEARLVRNTRAPHEVETMISPWVVLKTMASPDLSGAEHMSAVTLYFQPGQGHDRHNHPASEQLIVVLGGQGEMIIEDEAGTPVRTMIGPGSTVTIPKGLYHSTFNTGWEPLRILAVYSPPGPETAMKTSQEFRTLAPGALPKS